jgi:putative transposase
LRDEADLETHTHYIHFNPVKHGLVQQVAQWPYSTFHRFVKSGVYLPDWGVGVEGLSSVRE